MRVIGLMVASFGVLAASSAMAAGTYKLKTLKLKTLENRGSMREFLPGFGLTVRAPAGTVLSKAGGSMGDFMPYHGESHKTKAGMVIKLEPGRYYDASSNKVFSVTRIQTIFPRGPFDPKPNW